MTSRLDDLFVGLLTTSLAEDELLTSVNLPTDFAGAKQAYLKHAHPASGYAVVGVAVAIKEKDGKVESARIAVTGAPEHAKRAAAAEAAWLARHSTPIRSPRQPRLLRTTWVSSMATSTLRLSIVPTWSACLTKRALTKAAG